LVYLITVIITPFFPALWQNQTLHAIYRLQKLQFYVNRWRLQSNAKINAGIVGAAGGVARFPKGFRKVLMLVLTFYVMIALSNSDRLLASNLSLEVGVI
jgi:hypothetical protein